MRSSSRNIAILSSEANIASLRSNEDTQCATSRVLISRFCVMRMTLMRKLNAGLRVSIAKSGHWPCGVPPTNEILAHFSGTGL